MERLHLQDIIQDMEDNFNYKKYLAEGKLLKEEVDVLGNEFLQDIQDDMKMYYKMDVDMDDIKNWVNMYYIGYNSEYDEGPGDVDYEGNEFGSEDYESEKKELVFDTAEREDFYMHLNPEADSTFPNLAEGKLLKEAFYPEFKGETNDKINDIAIAVVDELESKLDSESSGILKGMDYYVGSDGMDNDEVEQGFTKWFIDLVKYLSKNNNEVTISSVEQDGKVFTPAITLKYLDNGKEDISWKIK